MDKMKEMKTKASVKAVGMRDRAKEMMNSPSGQTAPRFSATSRDGGEESATTCEPVRASNAPAVAARASETREQPRRAFEEDSEDELETRARREDLQRVADDASVRRRLRSERLQEIIRAIDAAEDGAKALAKAREDPEFRAFTEDALSLFER